MISTVENDAFLSAQVAVRARDRTCSNLSNVRSNSFDSIKNRLCRDKMNPIDETCLQKCGFIVCHKFWKCVCVTSFGSELCVISCGSALDTNLGYLMDTNQGYKSWIHNGYKSTIQIRDT